MTKTRHHTDTPIVPGRVVLISLALIALTWLVFGQTVRHGFINYDDGDYVSQNSHVKKGLTTAGLVWAFTGAHAGNWHPLTWISHMLDCQLFGLNPSGHHFTNVFLHSIAVVLLFLILARMSASSPPRVLDRRANPSPQKNMDHWLEADATMRAAFVAALFAVHPLRVESVAWVAERKDVLSAVFFMLTLAAYIRYTRAPSLSRYAVVAISFALGLMAQPMLVTLPLVLLILDYWPLRRFDRSAKRFWQLFVEKIPLLALSIAVGIATLFAQRTAILLDENHTLSVRIPHAISSTLIYIWQMIWPAGLCPFYPYTPAHNYWPAILSAIALIGLTVLFYLRRRKQPYLLAGWLWYLIMLLPVIGIIQVGMQARADRYTYLPQIGLSIMVVWGIADLAPLWKQGRRLAPALGFTVVGVLAVCAWRQTSYWRDSKTLWTHSLTVSPNNGVIEDRLGKVLLEERDIENAAKHFERAASLRPNSIDVHADLGNARFEQQRFDDAIGEFYRAILLSGDRRDFKTAQLFYNLGNAFRQQRNANKAISNYKRALTIFPDYSQAHYNLANQMRESRVGDAISHYKESLRIDPSNPNAHINLALALTEKKLVGEAVKHYEAALQIDKSSLLALNNLAWVLATSPDPAIRNGNRAVQLATRARQFTGENDPIVLHTLAAAYAEAGQFSEAVATAEKAMQLASVYNDASLVDGLNTELALYRNNQPYHEAR